MVVLLQAIYKILFHSKNIQNQLTPYKGSQISGKQNVHRNLHSQCDGGGKAYHVLPKQRNIMQQLIEYLKYSVNTRQVI